MPEFGTPLGLSVDFQADKRVNDLYTQQQMKQQALARVEAKAKMFAGDLDYNNAMNAWDNAVVKKYVRNKIPEIGKWTRENPDFLYNIEKRTLYNNMIHDLKDNPDLNRGLRVDAAKKSMESWLQGKDSEGMRDLPETKQRVQELKNYLTTGSADGVEGNQKEFTFIPPSPFVDLAKEGITLGNKFQDMIVDKLPGGGMGSYQEKPNEKSLDRHASEFYFRNKPQFDAEATKYGYSDPRLYAKQLIDAGIDRKRDFGDYSLLKEKAMADYKHSLNGNGHEGETWKYEIVNKPYGIVNPELLEQTLGSKPKAFIESNDGKQKLDISGSPIEYSGFHTYAGDEGKNRGVKNAEASVMIPIEKAEELGIYEDPYFASPRISAEWNKKATLESAEKDGKQIKYVKIKTMIPFDVNNSASAGIFNAKTVASKLRSAPVENYTEENSIYKYSDLVKQYGAEKADAFTAKYPNKVIK